MGPEKSVENRQTARQGVPERPQSHRTRKNRVLEVGPVPDPVLKPVLAGFWQEDQICCEGPRALWCFTGSSLRGLLGFCTESSKRRFGSRPGLPKRNHFWSQNFKKFVSRRPWAILDRSKSGLKAIRRGTENGSRFRT